MVRALGAPDKEAPNKLAVLTDGDAHSTPQFSG